MALTAIAVTASACSITSFEERQAALDESELNASASETETAEAADELVSGPVLLDEEPASNPDDPAWTDLELGLAPIAQYETPIALKARSGSEDLWVAQRNGVIRRVQRTFDRNGNERIAADTRVVLDISELTTVDGERGLLDIEFSLDGRLLYVSHTDLDGTLVVAEYNIARSNRADAGSRREVIRIPQPASNHNGGGLELGSDGFLYIGLGDGGGSGDPQGNGQNTSTLLGSIVRIDPIASETAAYLIPDGNPFVGAEGAPEIFLYGVRNPWRFSFDAVSGDLWIADVGQNAFEEINHFTAADNFGNGANLGWNELEAFEQYENGTAPTPSALPIFAYGHENGRCSITGGYVYRGERIPLLDGVYLFGDYCTGEVFGLAQSDNTMVRELPFELDREQLVSFGEGPDGELYVIEASGLISRIEPVAVVPVEG